MTSNFPLSALLHRFRNRLAAVGCVVAVGSSGQGAALAQATSLEIRTGDHIMLVGNTLAERMQLFNHFETLLMAQFADRQLVVRNLGWSGDTITLQPRPLNFGATPTHLYRQKADVLLLFFGLNESFAGESGLRQFEQDLDAYLRGHQSAKYNGQTPPRLALVSPIAHERLARLPRVDVDARNVELARYTDAMRRVATARGVTFVDLYTPTKRLMDTVATPLTINGIHLSEEGDRVVAAVLMEALGWATGSRVATPVETVKLEALRKLVRDKNQQFFLRWRPVNAEYVVGRRVEPFGSVNFPGEMKQLDEIVAARDRRIWERARAARGLRYPDARPPASSAKVGE
jgi:lysophospholipase L1-like esterase